MTGEFLYLATFRRGLMRAIHLTIAIAAIFACYAHVQAEDQTPFVLKPSRVFDGISDSVRADWVVVVRGNRIERVGPGRDISVTGARVVDLPGQTLVPGLIDAHSHVLLHPYNEALWDDQVLKEP